MTNAALPTLQAPRLTLRPLTPRDTDAIVQGIGNFDVSRWLGTVPYPYRVKNAETYLAKIKDEAQPVWAIDAGQGLIGAVSLHERLGYWLARPAWRKGYAFEACHTALSHWFLAERPAQVEAGHFQGNLGSAEVLRALGFVHRADGTTRALSLGQTVPSTELTLSSKRWKDRQSFTLKTNRLTLRPMAMKDAPFLVDLARPEVARMLFHVRPGWAIEDARAFIAPRRWQGLPGFLMLVSEGKTPLGYVGYVGQPPALVYALHPKAWGRGLASEALAAFLPELFERFPVARLQAEVFDDNPGSAAVLAKFGFRKTGTGTGPSAGRSEPAPLSYFELPRAELGAS